MQNGNRKYWWKLMHNPFIILLALILLFFLARAAWNVHRSANAVSAKLAQAQAEEERLEAEQQTLSAKISDISTPEGLESQLRLKYRAVKEGESVAVIVNTDQASGSESIEASSTDNNKVGLWDHFLGFFGL